MNPRSRGGSSRSGPSNRIQLRVFAEGEKTEVIYLKHWHRLYREKAIISIADHQCTTPFRMVQLAASQRRQDLRNARRGRGIAFDQYWCMVDVDEHPRVLEALNLASEHDIGVALSSPCLELWFMLHFCDQRAYLDRREAQRRSKSLLGCGKVLTQAALESLVTNFDIAKTRAQVLATKHEGDLSIRPWNPHSDVWKLVEAIKSA